jgi:hypothetical protein
MGTDREPRLPPAETARAPPIFAASSANRFSHTWNRTPTTCSRFADPSSNCGIAPPETQKTRVSLGPDYSGARKRTRVSQARPEPRAIVRLCVQNNGCALVNQDRNVHTPNKTDGPEGASMPHARVRLVGQGGWITSDQFAMRFGPGSRPLIRGGARTDRGQIGSETGSTPVRLWFAGGSRRSGRTDRQAIGSRPRFARP